MQTSFSRWKCSPCCEVLLMSPCHAYVSPNSLMVPCCCSRLDPVCRKGSYQPRDPPHLHCKVSTADHGLPGKGLLCQAAG